MEVSREPKRSRWQRNAGVVMVSVLAVVYGMASLGPLLAPRATLTRTAKSLPSPAGRGAGGEGFSPHEQTENDQEPASQPGLPPYPIDSPEVAVEIAGQDSRVYYIITEGPGLGDNVMRVPLTGNETLLDAISKVDGLSKLSSKKIWVARPAPGGVGCETVLPVDWEAISRGGEAATNYALIPGDRVFISEESPVESRSGWHLLTAPAEWLLGVASLGISTLRSSEVIGRSYEEYRGD